MCGFVLVESVKVSQGGPKGGNTRVPLRHHHLPPLLIQSDLSSPPLGTEVEMESEEQPSLPQLMEEEAANLMEALENWLIKVLSPRTEANLGAGGVV